MIADHDLAALEASLQDVFKLLYRFMEQQMVRRADLSTLKASAKPEVLPAESLVTDVLRHIWADWEGAFQHQERVAARFEDLVYQLMPSLAEMDPVPAAMVAQAQRRAALRTELLATGAFTYKELARGRHMTSANVRQWVRRARDRYELFTVDHDNESLVPALLLDADLMPRPAFQPVIAVLAGVGEDGWGLWAWLVHSSSWLDGKVPAEEIERDPKAVVRAAQDRASNAA